MGFLSLLRLLLIALVIGVLYRWAKRALTPPQAAPKPLEEAINLKRCPVCNDFIAAEAPPCSRADCPRTLKSGLTSAGVFLLLAAALASAPAMADDKMGGRYLLEMKAAGVSVNLEVNGVLAGQWDLPQAGQVGASLNHWLRQGDNAITLRGQSLAGGAKPEISLRLFFLGFNAAGQPQPIDLMTVHDVAKLHQGLTVRFNLPSAPALKLWQPHGDAQPRPAEAVQLVNGLRAEMLQALQAGQDPLAVPLLGTERDDLALAYGSLATSGPLEADPQSGQDKSMATPLLQEHDLTIKPLSTAGLFRVGGTSGAPLIALRKGAEEVIIKALIVGKDSSGYRILRRAN